MPDSDKIFAGSIPEIYDTFLVPLIFEAYASDLAHLVAQERSGAVLETAAGSGVVARALAPLLAPHARYVVTDLNQPMLDRAASRMGADGRIVWRQADALDLPFPDGSFDAVCCQFGVMFFPDRSVGYRQARRVLRAGGRLLFNVWDRIEDNVFARIVTDAAAEVFPKDPPRFLARTPHGYHDVARIEAELLGAGFSAIAIETISKMSAAPSAREPAVGYCQGTPLRSEIGARDPAALASVTEHAAQAIAKVCGEGPVSGKMQAHVVVARA